MPTGLAPQRQRKEVPWVQRSVEGSRGPETHLLGDQGLPSPFNTQLMDTPPSTQASALPLLSACSGLPLSPGTVARGSLLGWPEPPLHRVTSS